MKHNLIKPVLALLLAIGLHGTAQAAYLSYVSHIGSGGYVALTEGVPVNDTVADLSSPPTDVTLFGANGFNSSFGNGSLEHSYAADAFVFFSQVATDLSLSLTHSLVVNLTGPTVVGDHQQDAFVDLTRVTFRIDGQGNEAPGSPVMVRFQGEANALHDFGSVISDAYVGLGMSVSLGDTVLGEYLWDVEQSGGQQVDFSFAGNVGTEYTISAFMLSGGGLSGTAFDTVGPLNLALIDAGARLDGSFSVTAVPEPGTLALLLAGLGLVGYRQRRRQSEV